MLSEAIAGRLHIPFWREYVSTPQMHTRHVVCHIRVCLSQIEGLAKLCDGSQHNVGYATAGQGDPGTAGSISRADVAAVCVAALSAPAALKTTFELRTDSNEPGSADQISSIFTGLEKDSGPQ
jgi:hypothetical protein